MSCFSCCCCCWRGDENSDDDDDEDTWHELLVKNPDPPNGGDESADEDSDSQPGGIHNPDSHFNKSLLGLINNLRSKSNLGKWELCPELCDIAKDTWHIRSNKHVKNGFAYIPECDQGHRNAQDIADFWTCISYFDLLVHSKNDLPQAAFQYWSSNGRYSSITASGKYVWHGSMDPENRYPNPETVNTEELERSRSMIGALLLNPEYKRMGLYYKKAPAPLIKGGRRPYCVIAILDDCHPFCIGI